MSAYTIVQKPNGQDYIVVPGKKRKTYFPVNPARSSVARQKFLTGTAIGRKVNQIIQAYLLSGKGNSRPQQQNKPQDMCQWKPSGKPLGAGAYGVVYKVCSCPKCNDCQVYKIEKDHDCGKHLLQMIKNNNAVADKGMAPRILNHSICKGECKYSMEFVDGKQLWDVLKAPLKTAAEVAASKEFIDYLFKNVDKMHEILPHGHGDMSPANIMYTKDKKVTFIDFAVNFCTYSKRHWVFDYCQLLWYVIGDPEIHPELYVYIITKLIKIITSKYPLEPDAQAGLNRVMSKVTQAFAALGDQLRVSPVIEELREDLLNFSFYCKF